MATGSYCSNCGKLFRDGDSVYRERGAKGPVCPACTSRVPFNVGPSGLALTAEAPQVREFSTGATRDIDTDKPDYEGFLSPRVIQAFGEYMHKHRRQSDGTLRASDNWQKGMGRNVYMKSLWRHFFDIWTEHRGLKSREGMMDALMGTLFNVMGYAHEYIKEQENDNSVL